MAGEVEAEVKVRCDDFEGLIGSHPELAWEIVEPRHFEDNYVFDLPAEALANRGSILRLRVVGDRSTLTYKGLLPESHSSAMKVREELETGIEKPEVLRRVLERLGMRCTFRYQKFRTTYLIHLPQRGQAYVMLDETPLGGFLEIEGEELIVAEAADLLGYRPTEFIRNSYIGMQVQLCRSRGVPLEDLVFHGDGSTQPDGDRPSS